MNWVDLVLLSWLALTVPTYVIGRRRKVRRAWLAFVPIVGSMLILLLSMNASAWWLLALIVPVVLLVVIALMLPRRHERSPLWSLGILVPMVDVVVLYAYALTLTPTDRRVGTAIT